MRTLRLSALVVACIYEFGASPVRTNARIVPLSTASYTSSVTLKWTELVTSSPIDARQTIPSPFAGDNVVQQFEDVERREMAEDAPQEIETMFPG
ncbi:hypothetical protein AB1N83_013156 [Pleurotus pulmonarius]